MYEEGEGKSCVCLSDFESEGMDGGESEVFFHSSHKFHVGFLHFTQIPVCMYFIIIYNIQN